MTLYAKDYRQIAWKALSGKWGLFIGVTLLYSLISGACSMIPGVGSIASIIVSGPLYLGVVIVGIRIIRNERTKAGDMFEGFNQFGEAILLQLVNGIFIFLWSLLLIIPGIIKSYSYYMSTYILADNPGMSQSEARRKSEELMIGNKFRLFCLHFSFFWWILLSILTFGILMIWVGPYMQAANAAFYNDLVKDEREQKEESKEDTVEQVEDIVQENIQF